VVIEEMGRKEEGAAEDIDGYSQETKDRKMTIRNWKTL
jgi:hypothetical protein